MFKKIVLLMATLCVIQATPLDDLINELKPELERAASKVADVVYFGGEIIGLTYREIETRVAVLNTNIDEHQQQIIEYVEQVEIVANASRKNISACVEQEEDGRKTLSEDRRSLGLCRNSPVLNNATLKVNTLSKEEAVIGTATINCETQNHNELDKIRKCVEGIVANAENQANATEEYINSAVDEARERSNKCTNEAMGPISEKLKKIKEDFDDCVSHAGHQTENH